MRNLEGKVAVVTGAAHGIGRETALALAQKGCRLAICDVNEAALEGVRHELEAGGTTVTAHQVDMGGAAPGSQKVDGVTEAYQEGLRILPVRFVREGTLDEDIMRIVTGNVRMPDKVRGDLMAQLSANRAAAVRLASSSSTTGPGR